MLSVVNLLLIKLSNRLYSLKIGPKPLLQCMSMGAYETSNNALA